MIIHNIVLKIPDNFAKITYNKMWRQQLRDVLNHIPLQVIKLMDSISQKSKSGNNNLIQYVFFGCDIYPDCFPNSNVISNRNKIQTSNSHSHLFNGGIMCIFAESFGSFRSSFPEWCEESSDSNVDAKMTHGGQTPAEQLMGLR